MLKKLLIPFLVLLLLISAALWFVFPALNTESFKPYIRAQLESITSQPSQIKGYIHWHLFPQPGITVSDIVIGDNQKPSRYSLTLDYLKFNLQMAALLHRQFVFQDIHIKGLSLDLHPDLPLPDSKPIKAETAPSSLHTHFAINKLNIDNGTVIIHQQQRTTTLRHITLAAETINMKGVLFPLKLKTQIISKDKNQTLLKATAQFQGNTYITANILTDLSSLFLNGELTAHHIHLDTLKIDKLNAHVHLKSGLLALDPLTFNLYTATSVGALRYALSNNQLEVRQTATDLNSDALTTDLLQKNTISGKLDYSIVAQMNLTRHSQTANGYFNIRDGSINTIDINKVIKVFSHKISSLFAEKKSSSIPSIDSLRDEETNFKGKTAFSLITIPFTLQEDQLKSDALLLRTDSLQLSGKGSVNLGDKRFDGRLQAILSTQDAAVTKVQSFLGGSFPLIVKGYVTQPIILPDMAKINPILAGLFISDVLTKPIGTLTHQLKAILK